METFAKYNANPVCQLCGGTGWLDREPDLQDRSDEEPCPLCQPLHPMTFSEAADLYGELVEKGSSPAQAAAVVDQAMGG